MSPTIDALMGKHKVKSLVPLIGRSRQIVLSLIVRHGVPFLLAALVSPDVIYLGEKVDDNISRDDGDKLAVAATISRGIIRSIDIRRDDSACLHILC